jgi:hypothetical protein
VALVTIDVRICAEAMGKLAEPAEIFWACHRAGVLEYSHEERNGRPLVHLYIEESSSAFFSDESDLPDDSRNVVSATERPACCIRFDLRYDGTDVLNGCCGRELCAANR